MNFQALEDIKKNRWFVLFKLICSLLFPTYLVLININSQYTQDDFTLLENLKHQGGVFQATKWFYFNYEGSFLGMLQLFSLLSLPKFIFLLFTSFFHLFAVWFLVSSVFVYFKCRGQLLNSWVIASLFSAALYYLSLDASCLYHWMGGSVYLAAISYTLWATGFMLRKRYIIALFFFVFVMQTRINISAVVLSGYGMFFCYDYCVNKRFNKVFFISILLMVAALLMYIIAPGNYMRSVTNEMPSESFLSFVYKVFVDEYLFQLPRALIFSLAISFLLPSELSSKILFKSKYNLLPIVLMVFFVIVNMTCMLVISKLYYYAARVWALNQCVFFLTVCYYSIFLLEKLKQRNYFNLSLKLLRIAPVLFLILTSGVVVRWGKESIPLAQNYSYEFEKFTESLRQKHLAKGDTLWMPYLPNPGVLRYHKMEPIPTYISNYPYEIGLIQENFMKYYGIEYHVLNTKDTNLLNKNR